ncbi:histone acetyltransferases subunit 3-domain-containing protein [Coprinopsis sp. MPI-PUGE-AT-0042]|nr:histone acetyltransferases subunit 3-domain-containing protein [Coprinopsis sp. MPI-PUGE-AT-0042]
MASMPNIEELEQLQNELKMLRQNAVARSKKASEDLRTIHESMRRLKEKEKGKAKAVEKLKRERDYTPSLHEERHYPGSKPRTGSQPLASRPAIDDKKKKRKHAEVDPDSDGGHSSQRRKGSPAVSSGPSHSQKASKGLPPSVISYPKFGSQDFTIPPPSTLLSPRPPIPDFSKLKPPAHTLVTTFYSSIEGDEVEPLVMPKLGVHYLEVWEEQDATGRPVLPGKGKEAPASAFVAPKPTWDPSTLSEADLLVEEKGHGPLTERVISALLPIPDASGKWKGLVQLPARRERLNVTDLENRIRDTMRYHGLLDSVQPDFSEKVDDPIATALRQAQSEFRVVLATNKLRKERLASIARDRLGYQEYLEIRDTIDKNITNLYSKLQKKDVPKLSKKKKKPLAAKAARDAANGDRMMTNRLTVNDQLKHLVETRRKWVEVVGSVFEEKQRMQPGRNLGDVEEEVRKALSMEGVVFPPGFGAKPGGDGGSASSGSGGMGSKPEWSKARVSLDAMDTS